MSVTSPTEFWGPAASDSEPLLVSYDDYQATYTNEGSFQGEIDELRITNVTHDARDRRPRYAARFRELGDLASPTPRVERATP